MLCVSGQSVHAALLYDLSHLVSQLLTVHISHFVSEISPEVQLFHSPRKHINIFIIIIAHGLILGN